MAAGLLAILVPPDPYAALGVVLGAISLALDLSAVRRGRSGQLRQQEAMNELRRRIVSLAAGPNRQLISANHFRSLAVAIESEHRCPVITDKLIAETIRAAALELEDHHHGSNLVRLLSDLNSVLVDLAQAEPPLLSIARVDRLTAYVKSQPFAVGLLFAGVVVTALLAITRDSFFYLSISITLLLVELLFFYAAVRVEHFWSQSSLKPPRPLRDFFVVAMLSRSSWADKFWDILWGPLWEAPYFFSHAVSPIGTIIDSMSLSGWLHV